MLFNFLNVDNKTVLVLTANIPAICAEVSNISGGDVLLNQNMVIKYFEMLGLEQAINKFVTETSLMSLSEDSLVEYIKDTDMSYYVQKEYTMDKLLDGLI